ncbi:MAG TPA: hypothetical protein VF384_10435 [Planctomycetota bacterium]
MPSSLLLTSALLLPQQPADASADTLPRLSAPVLVTADGKPIVTIIGHAAPFVVDCDGDGVRDLVVGMFGSDSEEVRGGTARIYKNVGSNKEPRFGGFSTLLADGKPAAMESS